MRPSIPGRLRFWLSCAWAFTLLLGRSDAMPFTYQGRLVDEGVLANGNYELRFRLFDQLTAGTQVGADLSQPSVPVTNGIFTVQLDFGPGVFTGAPRWLELAARSSGDAGALEIFDPRQLVTAVPYALYALTGSSDASTLTTGTLPDDRLGPNIARSAALLSISNSLSARLEATNIVLQEQLNQLAGSLLAISNQFQALLLPGLTVASSLPADPDLLGHGLARFLTFDAAAWRNGATAQAPTPRFGHSALLTDQAVLVWGGSLAGGTPSGTGAQYDPSADQWSALSPVDSPTPRRGHSALWTGQSMLIWGGFGTGYLGDGAEYSPLTSTWTPLATLNGPSPRDGQGSAWTGTRMVIWGGRNGGGLLSDGALYNPVAKVWAALPGPGAPEARYVATVVWTGTHLIVWGGQGDTGELNTGARLSIDAGTTPGTWVALTTAEAPEARTGHSAVWTGQKLLIWGGQKNGTTRGDGAAYDPQSDSWAALPSEGAPTPRTGHVAVWTGDEMLIFGGESTGGALANGAAYRPATGKWRPLVSSGSPLARADATGLWTGSELLVFGGRASGSPLAALQRLNPQPTWYLYRKP